MKRRALIGIGITVWTTMTLFAWALAIVASSDDDLPRG